MLDPVTSIDFPFFQNQLRDMFGDPDDNGPFAQGYLRVIDLSEFADALAQVVDFQGNPWSCRIYGNYIMAGPLKKAFRALIDRDLIQELKTFDGCFNIRPMKSSVSTPSVHSWGLAIDLNAQTNPFSRTRLITDLPDEFVLCFLQAGFEWGGMWRSCKDPMHFQLPWTTDWRNTGAPPKPVPYVA